MCSKTIVVAKKSRCLNLIINVQWNEVKMGIHLYYKWDKPKQMDKVAVRVLGPAHIVLLMPYLSRHVLYLIFRCSSPLFQCIYVLWPRSPSSYSSRLNQQCNLRSPQAISVISIITLRSVIFQLRPFVALFHIFCTTLDELFTPSSCYSALSDLVSLDHTQI